MTILSRNASTVFNRTDFNILQVMDLSPPIPQLYAPNVFFSFFDVIFSINTTQPDFDQSSQYALLFMLSNYLQRSRDDLLDTGGGTRKLRLQDFLATPIAVFNDGRFPVSNEDVVPGMGTSISMAVPGYQVCLPPLKASNTYVVNSLACHVVSLFIRRIGLFNLVHCRSYHNHHGRNPKNHHNLGNRCDYQDRNFDTAREPATVGRLVTSERICRLARCQLVRGSEPSRGD